MVECPGVLEVVQLLVNLTSHAFLALTFAYDFSLVWNTSISFSPFLRPVQAMFGSITYSRKPSLSAFSPFSMCTFPLVAFLTIHSELSSGREKTTVL